MTLSLPSISRPAALALLCGATALIVGACASASTPTWTFATQPAAAPRAATVPAGPRTVMAASAATAHSAAMSMPMPMPGMVQPEAGVASAVGQPQPATAAVDITIVTGDMIGHTEFPAFIPSDITLPANATVTITITNFDDATALPKGSEQYSKVTGTADGTAVVTPIKAAYPNGSAGASQTLTSINPADVSHTLTIPGLGINIPIAAHARESFTIRTGAPGIYTWHCMDPCGDGTNGWGTAMATKRGFMEGTIRVA